MNHLMGINHLITIMSQKSRAASYLKGSFKAAVEGENQAYSKLSLRNHLHYQKYIVYRIDKKSARFSSSIEQIAVSFGGIVVDEVVVMCLGSMLYKKRKSNFNH